jgi:hypothetical protein
VALDALGGGTGNYNGATLTLARHNGASAQDVFGAKSGGTLAFVGSNVQISGTTVGTFTNTGGTLAITFNSSATTARVNAVLNQLTYANNSDAPPASVQIDYSFSDGNSGAQGPGGPLAATGSVTVNITATNDTPDLTPNSPSAVTYITGQSGSVALLSTGAVSDPDKPANFSGGSFSVAINSAQSGDEIVLNAGTPLTVVGSNVMDGATAIGTISGLDSSSVSVSLNSAATPTEVDKLVEAFGFETTSSNTSDRSVQFTFNDGSNTGSGGALSDSVTQTVHVSTPPPAGTVFFVTSGNVADQFVAYVPTNATTPTKIFQAPAGVFSPGTPGPALVIDTAANLYFVLSGTQLLEGNLNSSAAPTAVILQHEPLQ